MGNANKSSEVLEKWSRIPVRDWSTIKVSQFFQLVGPVITPSFNEIGLIFTFSLILLTE